MAKIQFSFQGYSLGGQKLDHHLTSSDRLCLRGENGCGKTSLLNILAGLTPHPNHPAITRTFNRNSVADTEQTFQAECHWLGHCNGHNPQLTIAEDWLFWHKILHSDSTSTPLAATDIAKHVGLNIALNRPMATLSAGQKQKAALARLFIAPRSIWLLDEPDSHLDSHSRAILENWMRNHCAKGGIIIDSSHFQPNFGTTLTLESGQ